MQQKHLPVLGLITGCVLLNVANSPLFELFFDDKEIFKYIGLVMSKGGVPYRDVFDHKPPLIYFLNTLHWTVGPWAVWLLDSLLVVLATVLFFDCCKKNKLPWPWLLPLLFNLLIRNSLVSFGNGMTREYTAIFLLLSFSVQQLRFRYTFYILGILAGLTFMMQQDAIITLLPFLMYAFRTKDGQASGQFIKRMVSLLSGSLTIILPVILYFVANRSAVFLWEDAFVFNFRWPDIHISLPNQLRVIKHAIHEAEYEMPFYVAAILGMASIFLKHKKRDLLFTALLGLALSFCAVFLSGRLAGSLNFIYYLLPLAATIPILLFAVFTGSEEPFLTDRRSPLIYGLLASFTLFLGSIRYASTLLPAGTKPAWSQDLPSVAYLKTQNLSDDELFVFYDSNLIYLYNFFHILAPSKWIYHYFYGWYPGWDSDHRVIHSMIDGLVMHKTRYIIDCSDTHADFRNNPAYPIWKDFLKQNYIALSTDASKRILWRIQ